MKIANVKVYKTKIIPIKCSKMDTIRLKQASINSASVWNLCLKIDESFRNENNGKWIDRNAMQKLTKKCVDLHAKGIHHVVHKYIRSRDGAQAAKKVGRLDVLYPYKTKKYFVVGWDYQSFKIEQGRIKLSMPEVECEGKKKKQKPIICFAKNLPTNIQEVELIFREKYYLAVKYVEFSDITKVSSKVTSSIDLGEIHAITSIDSLGNSIIITGRIIRSVKRLRNKSQADIYRKMSKCQKGSKKYNRYRSALKKLTAKSDRKINDLVHKCTKKYLDFCISNNVSKVFYGDLDSCTRNIKKNKIGNDIVRQKLSQWNFGELISTLESKLKRNGISLEMVDERYTSQRCPKCKKLNKPRKRNYSCGCGYSQHRDIVGAINILNNNTDRCLTKYKTKRYLRIA